MEIIIQQITLELPEKITKKVLSKELSDMDRLAAELLEDCTQTAKQLLKEAIKHRNLQLREDKTFRKKKDFS